jgi:S-DNA-T family DNA segregation ATPase FtsK/SpoIIIE
MAKNKEKNRDKEKKSAAGYYNLHPEIKKSVWVVVFFGLAVIFILAAIGQAGPIGGWFYNFFYKLLGWGYYLLPAVSLILAFSFCGQDPRKLLGLTLIGSVLFVLSTLGLIDIIAPGASGWVGNIVGSLKKPFGIPASIVITLMIAIASFIIVINKPLKLTRSAKYPDEDEKESSPAIKMPLDIPAEPEKNDEKKVKGKAEDKMKINEPKNEDWDVPEQKNIKNYVPPPLSLLASSVEKPTVGDLRANANIIKRTLESFGIMVEMGEINVGPAVTRYTLKPAEGIKLSRITTLNQDLAMALAAHPIRIEAPIPGKSLVGIEVPNKAAAIVRLGSLLLYPDFQKAEPLTFCLGRDVQGDPIFPNIDKMPHLLIAGATGSGKSIAIHSVIISLLFKNSPEMLRLIMIDPKRVELSVYDGLPHLIAPVVTDLKKAISGLRWAVQEMERRYQLLLEAGSRDIKSYNKGNKKMPYILIIIDEMADLMTRYGRDVEGLIIRLAQMSRATGIHLLVSTQRPSVEVITGLIKANITSRVALQVASQIDSRTILDTSGAEKLLGSGDLLYISAEKSKPVRIQGSFLTEEEIKKVAGFIKKNNAPAEEGIDLEGSGSDESNGIENGSAPVNFDDYDGGNDEELYEEAVEVVRAARKASASLLQRRLKVGYARAARLLDMMEEKGVVGPGEGAKPRDVYL